MRTVDLGLCHSDSWFPIWSFKQVGAFGAAQPYAVGAVHSGDPSPGNFILDMGTGCVHH